VSVSYSCLCLLHLASARYVATPFKASGLANFTIRLQVHESPEQARQTTLIFDKYLVVYLHAYMRLYKWKIPARSACGELRSGFAQYNDRIGPRTEISVEQSRLQIIIKIVKTATNQGLGYSIQRESLLKNYKLSSSELCSGNLTYNEFGFLEVEMWCS
jgi:hypothetical protein